MHPESDSAMFDPCLIHFACRFSYSGGHPRFRKEEAKRSWHRFSEVDGIYGWGNPYYGKIWNMEKGTSIYKPMVFYIRSMDGVWKSWKSMIISWIWHFSSLEYVQICDTYITYPGRTRLLIIQMNEDNLSIVYTGTKIGVVSADSQSVFNGNSIGNNGFYHQIDVFPAPIGHPSSNAENHQAAGLKHRRANII